MPNVDGKEFSYTPAGIKAAGRARARATNKETSYDKTKPKTKGDKMASNVMGTLKNIGY